MESPPQNKKTYLVTPTSQLVDLNGQLTNFEINVKVASQDGRPFEICVIDQTMLDKKSPFEYQRADQGHVSIDLTNDKGIYQNYFLALRAQEPCRCDVEITAREIPAKVQQPVVPVAVGGGVNYLKIGLIVLAVGIGAYLVYKWLWTKKSPSAGADNAGHENYHGRIPHRPERLVYDGSKESPLGSPDGSPIGSPVTSHREASPTSGTARNDSRASNDGGNPLLDRLKKLNL